MGDAAESVGAQEHHLVFPCVCTQRPTMAEENGLASAPVFVIDLSTVLSGKFAHGGNSSKVEPSRTQAPGSGYWPAMVCRWPPCAQKGGSQESIGLVGVWPFMVLPKSYRCSGGAGTNPAHSIAPISGPPQPRRNRVHDRCRAPTPCGLRHLFHQQPRRSEPIARAADHPPWSRRMFLRRQDCGNTRPARDHPDLRRNK